MQFEKQICLYSFADVILLTSFRGNRRRQKIEQELDIETQEFHLVTTGSGKNTPEPARTSLCLCPAPSLCQQHEDREPREEAGDQVW